MTSLVEQLRKQVAECEVKAKATTDPAVRRTYIDVAAEWRELCPRLQARRPTSRSHSSRSMRWPPRVWLA